ncbi:MAG: isopentenyl phosphate kinase [Candidatus Micrarchaeales archaeon]
MKNELYFIKLGGSIITDTSKPSTHRKDQILRLLGEIKTAKKSKDFDLILGHGAGSFGHITAKQYRIDEGIINDESIKGIALTHKAMRDLNRIVIEAAEDVGLSLYPFAPSSFAHSHDKKIVGGDLEAMKKALSSGFIPIVHGDGMFDSKQGVSVASTEEVFRFIATGIKPSKIILGTDMDGVYDSDPAENPNAKLVPLIDSSNIEGMIMSTGGARKVDVTGGMKTKLTLLYDMAKSTGATGYIVNAGRPGVIENLLVSGEAVGTKVVG